MSLAHYLYPACDIDVQLGLKRYFSLNTTINQECFSLLLNTSCDQDLELMHLLQSQPSLNLERAEKLTHPSRGEQLCPSWIPMWYPNFQRERNTAAWASNSCRAEEQTHCAELATHPSPSVAKWKNYHDGQGSLPGFSAGKWFSRAGTWCWSGMDTAPLRHAPDAAGAADPHSACPQPRSPAPCPAQRGKVCPSIPRGEGPRGTAPSGLSAAAASPCCSRGSSSCWRSWRGGRRWGSARGASARPSPGAGSVPAAAAWRHRHLPRGGRADPRPRPPLPQRAAWRAGPTYPERAGGDYIPRRALRPAFQPQALRIVVE